MDEWIDRLMNGNKEMEEYNNGWIVTDVNYNDISNFSCDFILNRTFWRSSTLFSYSLNKIHLVTIYDS